MIDVDLEFDQAICRLERAGCVLPGDLCLWVPALGLQAIEPDVGGGLYQPAEAGKIALVIPVYDGSMPCFMRPADEVPELIDLVAFSLSNPRRWWRRTGLAEYLGEHFIQAAVSWHKRLRVLETPLAWLNARGCGVCPLTTDYSALRCVMAGLKVDDSEFGDSIDRQHKHPFPTPPIFVKVKAEHDRCQP